MVCCWSQDWSVATFKKNKSNFVRISTEQSELQRNWSSEIWVTSSSPPYCSSRALFVSSFVTRSSSNLNLHDISIKLELSFHGHSTMSKEHLESRCNHHLICYKVCYSKIKTKNEGRGITRSIANTINSDMLSLPIRFKWKWHT